jgi:predicted transcriptional regulator
MHEVIQISPEGLEIAQVYLKTQSIEETAQELKLSPIIVQQYLEKTEVKNFVNHVFLESGYRNRFKIAELMDQIIEKKLEELQEAEIGSSKDILEIIAFQHKMRMDLINADLKLEALKAQNIKQQTNIQINSSAPYGDQNYGKLLDKLLEK